jgi:exopolysaccharide biosynthesis polyprenyl glycosylphosphotransferase
MLATAEKDLRLCNIISDQFALAVSIVLAILIRFYLPGLARMSPRALLHPGNLLRYLALMALWYWCMQGTGNYQVGDDRNRRMTWSAIQGTLLFTVIVLAMAFFQWSLFSRAAVVLFALTASMATVALRKIVPQLLMRMSRRQKAIKVLLIGEGPVASHISSLLDQSYGHTVIHLMSLTPPGITPTGQSDVDGLKSLLQQYSPDEVILAREGRPAGAISELLNLCNDCRIPWHFVPTLDQLVFSNVRTHLVGGLPLIGVPSCALSALDLAVKRLIDIVVAATIMICAAPLFATIWLAVRLTSPGSAMFVQKRVGHKGRAFDFYKFRTMYVRRDDKTHREYVAQWISNQAYSGADARKTTFKIVNDPRITPVGRLLRRYSLDELPQLLNVLKGDMSLVGPRPALLYEIEMYKEWHKERLEGIPGLTGLWQVAGRNQLSFDEMVKLDLQYLRNWSPAQDLKLILKTVPAVLLGTGH